MIWLTLLLIVITISVLIHYTIKKRYKYFKNRGVDAVVTSNPYVSIFKLLSGQMNMVTEQQELYYASPNKRFIPSYMVGSPLIMLRDPEVIREVTVKNFDHYTDHVDIFLKEDTDPILGRSIFALKGKRWHDMRTTLSPSFTGSKMRAMFDLMNDCGYELVAHLNKITAIHKEELMELDFKDITARFTNDMIATIAFGVKINSFENPDNEFYTIGKMLASLSAIKFLILMLVPKIGKFLGLTLMPQGAYDFFSKMVLDTISTREREKIVRPDMLQLLIELKQSQQNDNETTKKTELTNEDLISQSLIFFFAGFDAVSTAMSFTIYELTVNPDIQVKLQSEIDEVSRQGLTYDSLLKMKYLDMVISESLRKWPPTPVMDRCCTKTHTLDIGDGESIVIEQGMNMQLPIYSLHHDPENFPDPELFDPERFSDERKDTIKPFSYIPFGVGPRMCIANRFALLEAKVLIFHLFANFNFEVTKRTPIPIILQNGPTNLKSKNGYWIGIRNRK